MKTAHKYFIAFVIITFTISVNGRASYLCHIYFDSGSFSLRPESKDFLNNTIIWLNEKPDVKIDIVGSSDARGWEKYNLWLSWKRAKVVNDYLIEKGDVDSSRLGLVVCGSNFPQAINTTKEGRQLNRNVTFRVIGSSGPCSPPGELLAKKCYSANKNYFRLSDYSEN